MGILQILTSIVYLKKKISSLGEESVSKLLQVVSIQFLVFVGLWFPFPCGLSAGSSSQLPELFIFLNTWFSKAKMACQIPHHTWNLSDMHFYYQLEKTLRLHMAHVIRLGPSRQSLLRSLICILNYIWKILLPCSQYDHGNNIMGHRAMRPLGFCLQLKFQGSRKRLWRWHMYKSAERYHEAVKKMLKTHDSLSVINLSGKKLFSQRKRWKKGGRAIS